MSPRDLAAGLSGERIALATYSGCATALPNRMFRPVST
jgi:hypothetical protein